MSSLLKEGILCGEFWGTGTMQSSLGQAKCESEFCDITGHSRSVCRFHFHNILLTFVVFFGHGIFSRSCLGWEEYVDLIYLAFQLLKLICRQPLDDVIHISRPFFS